MMYRNWPGSFLDERQGLLYISHSFISQAKKLKFRGISDFAPKKNFSCYILSEFNNKLTDKLFCNFVYGINKLIVFLLKHFSTMTNHGCLLFSELMILLIVMWILTFLPIILLSFMRSWMTCLRACIFCAKRIVTWIVSNVVDEWIFFEWVSHITLIIPLCANHVTTIFT